MVSGAVPSTSATAAGAQLQERVRQLLAEVPDPEIPVLNVLELGLIRYVRELGERRVEVGVSPTYTGCPATEVIRASIAAKLAGAGLAARVESVLAPPWSSDWLSESARAKLRAYGITPPAHAVDSPRELWHSPVVRCPRCDSLHTQRVSEFGSTPCKAAYRCGSCLEPFEYFKCI